MLVSDNTMPVYPGRCVNARGVNTAAYSGFSILYTCIQWAWRLKSGWLCHQSSSARHWPEINWLCGNEGLSLAGQVGHDFIASSIAINGSIFNSLMINN